MFSSHLSYILLLFRVCYDFNLIYFEYDSIISCCSKNKASIQNL
ncbi:hypothetical protein HMPREF1985_01036 [Mitsuokella sp. oral taxon 131 str. W9106]|nr:hypothetical protein HMPREF1985_01036 [Mitsuokella sp. oral taxon 131 str. W9106]